jgi:hypothetical protein
MTRMAYILLFVAGAMAVTSVAMDPSDLTLTKGYNEVRMINRIDIHHGEELVHSIGIIGRADLGSEHAGEWRLGLPYGKTFFEDMKPWDPVPVPGLPALLVLEYRLGGATGLGHVWLMRIFLLEDGKIREIPPIEGGGEVYLFRDFNGDGRMEFANQEYLHWHELDEEGIPLSPRVYRFNGSRYVPVTEVETWDDVLKRHAEWRDAPSAHDEE